MLHTSYPSPSEPVALELVPESLREAVAEWKATSIIRDIEMDPVIHGVRVTREILDDHEASFEDRLRRFEEMKVCVDLALGR